MNTKYKGIIPAFYACYGEDGKICPQRVAALARHLAGKGVQGLYVCGSSGECIYQSVAERKLVLESVMAEVGGKLTVIAHVGANNTMDSVELARHAASLGVDAIASIPPIYFKLPEHAVAEYWNAMSAAAPETDFIIYNIPQLAGTALTPSLLKIMRENPLVKGVKNSSDYVQDILAFKRAGGEDLVVFNGPDEQYVAGRVMGADGGIGGTYGVMPELYLRAEERISRGDIEGAKAIQYDIVAIIDALCGCKGHMYAVIKELLRMQGFDIGGVRAPLPGLAAGDMAAVREAHRLIGAAIDRHCNAERTA